MITSVISHTELFIMHIIMGNFMCRLDCVTKCPDSWINTISRFVLLKEINIWIGGLNKADGCLQCGYHPIHCEAWIEQKGGGRLNYLCLTAELDIEYLLPLAFLFLRPLDSDWNPHHQLPLSQTISIAFQGFQLAGGGLWHFSASIFMWDNPLW